ncbi:DegT/DnrJ/EryC1/StrS aminotransferase family protein [Hoeflea sp. YIM 152468]|uniref:DegT/DnrJ/EryC1/StrS family aminotransferase n=1 Tax=Hoeflea sp. YIM 152468 TaxID=3031759 RepID=UPI0023DAA956|nr:DegT/DnrJ/EryC1/StrS aminotransferase family protein [Hoeflea sp. YIM 152468]MDF1610261.1 DegT/DnrJ/EryC1/StrS aminotransferase family protein [Hoeflea sp. YIM 152468]
MNQKIDFIDLKAQRRHLGEKLDAAIMAAVNEGNYIMGPQVKAFEQQLSAFSDVKNAISCANGTDAIGLCLMAKKVRPGDAVIVPSFTFASTAEVVAWLGATPVFVDIDQASFNMDPKGLELALAAAKKHGLRTVGVISVDLFGQPADYDPIESFCDANGLWLIADSAQGYGSIYKGRKSGAIGTMATTSFFPAKPLGCYGDGGALFTADDEVADVIRSLRVHGKGSDKYDNVRIGVNSRLDTLQAAILIEKLAIYEEEIAARQIVADRYEAALSDVTSTPQVMADCRSVWAQYTLRVDADKRQAIIDGLKAKGVPTAVYYPRPLHQQTAYSKYPAAGNGLPVSERVCNEVLSLPMHPYLEEATQDFICEAVRDTIASVG